MLQIRADEASALLTVSRLSDSFIRTLRDWTRGIRGAMFVQRGKLMMNDWMSGWMTIWTIVGILLIFLLLLVIAKVWRK